MVNDWPLVSLKDAAQFFSGGTPPKSKPEYWGGDIPWISAKSMKGSRFNDSDLKLTEAGLKKGSRLAPKDSILLLVRGSMLHQRIPVGIVTKNVAFNQDVKAIVPNEKFLPLYFYYCFAGREKELLSKVENTGIGAGKLDTAVLNKIEFYCPPLPEQKAIAHILGALDDKIELNRQMNETLEAMAQALFKSWFIDFDPVIDNALAAGNSIPDELFEQVEKRRVVQKNKSQDDQGPHSLFPDEFEFTEEMGWIPRGWEVTPAYEVADFINGSSFKSQYFSDENEGLPIVKIAEIKNGISEQTKFTTQEMPEKYLINDGAILFSWSGNPDTSIDTFIWTGGKGWLNQHIFNVVLHKASDKTFVYYLLKYLKPIFTEIARDKQTTGLGHITVKDMKRIYTIKPTDLTLEAFGLHSNSIFERWYQNLFSSRELTKLRDTLLPKLLSGELCIPDAVALVEDA